MYKKFITALLITFLASILIYAYAEQDKGAETPKGTATTDVESGEVESGTAVGAQTSVLDQPVDFSSPEAVDESIDKVRQEAGEKKAREMTVAMKYILTYDLSVGHNKEKMHKKLDGSTPNEIIARMKR